MKRGKREDSGVKLQAYHNKDIKENPQGATHAHNQIMTVQLGKYAM